VRAGDKYSVLLLEDPDAEEEDARGGPRVAFQVMPTAAVQPAPAPAWQSVAAGVLFLFTAATSLQLGLAANVSLLPKVHPAAHLLHSLLASLLNTWRRHDR
jgi:hypothetical protein